MNSSMMAAAALFAVGTAAATATGFRERVPSEPFGAEIPGTGLDDRAGRLLSATGVSAPWPMPVLCLIAAASAAPGKRWPQRVLTTIGVVVTIGTLIEPVTWGRRSREPRVLATIPLNLVSGAALIAAGRR